MTNIVMYRKPLPDCSVGVMIFDKEIFHTIERPWVPSHNCRGGKPYESCIPFGTYRVSPYNSVKYGKVWCLVNPGLGVYKFETDRKNKTDRFACLIHAANWARQVQGCIAPGMGANYDGKERMVTHSNKALERLRALIEDISTLEIRPYEE